MPAAAVRAPDVKPGRPGERSEGFARGGRSGLRPLTSAPRPRRVSGPARRASVATPAHRRTGAEAGIALRAIAGLDRLSRLRLASLGRTWIALVAFALIGIVALQLVVLKLNGSIGRALEHEALLQRENAALSIENSELAASPRVEAGAERIGMQLVPPGALRFLAARPGFDPTRAAALLSMPIGASPSGSSEASAGGSLTPTQSGAAGSGAEASAAENPASHAGTSARESSGASTGATAPAPEQVGRGSVEAPTRAEPQQSSTPTPSPATAPGGGSNAEAGPGGGTQAAPQG